MIPRYSRPDMVALWSDTRKYEIWLEIETLAAEAMAEIGTVPAHVPAAIRERGGFDEARIDVIEAEVKHDVIAFLTSVTEHVGEEARYLHQGMTSSDILDTALAVRLRDAADILLDGMDKVLDGLRSRIEEHRDTLTMGRSHAIHAEPTSFGLKLATHFACFARHRARLAAARDEVATCAISGPVGTFSSVDPRVEAYVADRMGLTVEPVSTQVIPRDRHAQYFAVLAGIAGAVEALSVEIRHLQRTELGEAEEWFAPLQKGSSAMPHKRNPVLSENLTGLARVVRSSILPALENAVLWHERDISHSSVERMIAPDATVTLDFALSRLAGLVSKLVVHKDAMARNMDMLHGLHHSQAVMLALTTAGMDRDSAYRLVQGHAMAVWENRHAADEPGFRTRLEGDDAISERLDSAALDGIFNDRRFLTHVDQIIDRVLASHDKA
ncbi:MAG: adenylosuccinate lyase [Alphaproteobacteria bacterium]